MKPYSSYLIFIFLSLQFYGGTQTIFRKKITIEEGLISNDNYRVISDSKGAVWVCSERGVVKFFGNSTKQFTIKDGLLDNDVWNFHCDSGDRIWLSDFAAGMHYIENDKVKSIKGAEKIKRLLYKGEHKDTVFFVAEDFKTNKRYYFTNGKFGYYNPFKVNGLELKLDLRKFGFVVLSKFTENKEYQIDYLYNLKTSELKRLPFPIETINKDGLHDEDHLYMMNSKVVKPILNGFARTKIVLPNDLRYCFLSGDNLIVSSNSGFQIYSKKLEVRNVDLEQKIYHNLGESISLITFCSDKEGNLWLAEERGNVYFIHQNAFWSSHIPITNYMKSYRFNWSNLTNEQSNHLLFFDHKHQIHGLNLINKKFYPMFQKDGLRKIEFSKDKIIVLADNIMLYEYISDGNNLKTRLKHSYQLPLTEVSLSFEFIDADRILLSGGNIVSGIEKNDLKLEKIKGIKLPQRVLSMTYSDSLIAYFSNDEVGVFDLRTEKQRLLKIENPTSIKFIDNVLFIGTDGKGIYRTTKGENYRLHFTPFHNKVNEIVKINKVLYVCSDFGLFECSMNSSKKFAVERGYFYYKSMGIDVRNLLFWNNQYILCTNQGIIAIGAQFNQLKASDSNSNFLAREYKLSSNYPEILSDEQPLFPFENQFIQIEFIDNSQFNLAKTAFRYKLIGKDTNWIYSWNGKVNYSNLKSGSYTFVIESAANENLPYANQRKLFFSIDKPYYLKRNFLIPGIIILILLAVSIYYIGKYFSERKAVKKSELKTLELKALRAQLNPHFIFNSLNSIQSTLILKGQLEANDYIVEFSNLMRKVLNNSRNEKISLKHEIDFITSYLALENRRQKYRFVYEISVDESININKTMVYVMIFQPIVENAIVHGLLREQQDKKIEISFRKEGNYLITSIYDNGIGIKKSMELNQDKLHQSLASTILKEKTDILNTLNSNELVIESLDLPNDVPGTTILVRMRI